MNVLEAEIVSEQTGGGRWRFYPIGDLHVDAAATDRDKIKRYIARIAADPNAFWVCVGDLVDGTTPSHKWFEVGAVAPDVLVNMDRYVSHAMLELENLLAPLAKVPGVMIQGNHDIRHGGTLWSGLVWEIARRLNENHGGSVQYGGDECMVRLHVAPNTSAKNTQTGTYVYVIHAFHGAGGGMYPGGKVNRYENTIGKLTDADIMVRGHVHDSDIRIIPQYTVTRGRGRARLKEKRRAFITAPAFWPARKEGLNNYASRKGYPPNDDGILILNLECPDRRGKHDGRMWREELPL